MPLTIPPAVRYPNPIVALADPWQSNNPPEGPRLIPFEVLWATMGGSAAAKAISFELLGGGTGSPNDFTRINALSVDNSQCGADVQFVFTDTGETISIPAYSPLVIVPVFSQSKSFYLLNIGGVLSTDITRFKVHNTLPPPIAVPTSQEQTVAGLASVPVAVGSSVVVPAGVNGTLQNGVLALAVVSNPAASFAVNVALKDGSGNLICTTSIGASLAGGGVTNQNTALMWQVDDVHIRFTNGINLIQTLVTGAISGTTYVNVNLYYRTP